MLGLDADPQALTIAAERLAPYEGRFELTQTYSSGAADAAAAAGFASVDGVVCDWGVSSMQLDTPERGFSFQEEGPLDMRFGPDAELTAADIVNEYSQEELARVLYEYGDERRSRRIARVIVERRPLLSPLISPKPSSRPRGKAASPFHLVEFTPPPKPS